MRAEALLLFDIDGTLLSCQGRGVRAMHRAVQRVFERAPAAVEILPGGKTDPMLFEELAAAYAIALEIFLARDPEVRAAYVLEFAAELQATGACETKPGVAALLGALGADPGIRLGLVTGNLEPTARLKLASVALDGYFAGGGFGSDARHREELVALARARCAPHVGPERTWVIGDTPADVASGRAHGMRTLAVATGSFERGELEACGADVVLDDLGDTVRVVDILCRGG